MQVSQTGPFAVGQFVVVDYEAELKKRQRLRQGANPVEGDPAARDATEEGQEGTERGILRFLDFLAKAKKASPESSPHGDLTASFRRRQGLSAYRRASSENPAELGLYFNKSV